MLALALETAEFLAKEGIECEVVDLRVLRPLDKEAILKSARKTGRIIILHEDSKFMGFGAEVAASVAEDPAFYALKARVLRVAALDTPIPANLTLENYRLPSRDKLVAAAKMLMEES